MTQHLSKEAIEQIEKAMQVAGPYGSLEIIIQNSIITQINSRHIEKTNIKPVEQEMDDYIL